MPEPDYVTTIRRRVKAGKATRSEWRLLHRYDRIERKLTTYRLARASVLMQMPVALTVGYLRVVARAASRAFKRAA